MPVGDIRQPRRRERTLCVGEVPAVLIQRRHRTV
jgi:hypothetical protein